MKYLIRTFIGCLIAFIVGCNDTSRPPVPVESVPVAETVIENVGETAPEAVEEVLENVDANGQPAHTAPVEAEDDAPTVTAEVIVVNSSVKPPRRNSRYSDEYDDLFEEWTAVYLPLHDFTMLKAQCYQESLLNPTAMSHVGAKGLCQFMDFTWKDVSKPLKFPPGATAYDPALSVQAAAYYDAKIRRMWKAPRPEQDRMNLVFASYNAGGGHIIKAQKLCGGVNLYADIIKCLPDVTGHHSKETTTYVQRIRRWEKEMQFD